MTVKMDTSTAAPPNILVIMADQLRHDWLGYSCSGQVRTPHIDALAQRGMVFTHCCTNSPVCGPARIALATGLLPVRTGTLSNRTAIMPVSVPNHYRHFRDHGYRVEYIGRHDLAKPGAPGSIYGTRPLNACYGFTSAFEVDGVMSGALRAWRKGTAGGPYTAYLQQHGLLQEFAADHHARSQKGWIIGASHDWPLAEEHHPDAFVCRHAVERLRTMEDDYPWYMTVSFHAPHDPYAPPQRFADRYRQATMPEPIPATASGGRPARIGQRQDHYRHASAEDILIARRQYSAKVEHLDELVGELLATLAERPDAANTMIVFTSDHGDHLGDHGLFIKHTAYEPSLRVPMILAGTGIPAGRTSEALVELADLGPTLVACCDLPPQPDLDARSFRPVLCDDTIEHRSDCFTCEEGYRALRTHTHTYIETLNDPTVELYDLINDPGQHHNIAARDPDMCARLAGWLHQRLVRHPAATSQPTRPDERTI